MQLSGFTSPNTPDGDYEDKDLGIIILMKDGQGVGVKQTDGSYAPFPYEFNIMTAEPKNTAIQRIETEPEPPPEPQTIWGIPVVFSELPEKENELPPGNWIMGIDPAAWPESMGIDFARPDSDQTGITLASDELDVTLLSIIEGGRTDSVSVSVNLDELPDPDSFVEITTKQVAGTAREFMERFWEPEPSNARLQYRAHDKVKSIRKDLYGWVPVGAEGIVQSIEHPESHMASKGKHFSVTFDLNPFHIKIDETMREAMRRALPDGSPVPEYHEFVTTNVGVLDIEMVEKGDNWNLEYKHPFNEDAILEAMESMTPDEWANHLANINEGIIQKLRAERRGHPFGDLGAEDISRREMLNAHRAATELRGDDTPEFIRPPFIPDYLLKGTVDRYTRDFFQGRRPEPRKATFLSDDYLDGTLPPPEQNKMLGAGDLPPLELPPFNPDGKLKFWDDKDESE